MTVEEIIAAVQRLTGARAADPRDGDEILAALHAAGYAVVPREPTNAICEAFEDAFVLRFAYVPANPWDAGSALYRAMIAAAEAGK